MLFAEFYTTGAVTGNLVPACGNDSVVRIDARQHLASQVEQARKVAVANGFPAFKLMRGVAYNNANPVTELIVIGG